MSQLTTFSLLERTSLPVFPNMHTPSFHFHPLLFLFWASLQLTALTPPTSAFPIFFPPSYFSNSHPLSPDQLSLLTNPQTTIPWNPNKNHKTTSPPILLCSGPALTGLCELSEDNAAATCLNVDIEVGSLKVGDRASCAVYDSPACTGKSTTFASTSTSTSSTADPNSLALTSNHRIASLFCEPTESFTAVDPSSAPAIKTGAIDSLPRSSLKRNPRKRHADFPAPLSYPQPEAQTGASASDSDSGSGVTPSLDPWKPPPDSWPGKAAQPSCGDGQWYANGVGCMGP